MNHTVVKCLSILLVLVCAFRRRIGTGEVGRACRTPCPASGATHGTVLCSWMCAAGTVLDTAVVTFQAELSPIALVTLPHFAQPSIELCQTSSSRAPPLSLCSLRCSSARSRAAFRLLHDPLSGLEDRRIGTILIERKDQQHHGRETVHPRIHSSVLHSSSSRGPAPSPRRHLVDPSRVLSSSDLDSKCRQKVC